MSHACRFRITELLTGETRNHASQTKVEMLIVTLVFTQLLFLFALHYYLKGWGPTIRLLTFFLLQSLQEYTSTLAGLASMLGEHRGFALLLKGKGGPPYFLL